MDSTEPYFSLVRTSKSSWVAVPINRTGVATNETAGGRKTDEVLLRGRGSVSKRLIAQTLGLRAAFSERYPRLTIALIALLLFGAGVTVEVELFFHAGYLRR
jgi:hypothetical protein